MPLYSMSISISYSSPRSHFALVGFFAALQNEDRTPFSFPAHSDTGKRSGPSLSAHKHTASMLQPNPKCKEFSMGDDAQQPCAQEEREAREVERKKMGAPTSSGGKSMRARRNGGATSSGGAMNSLCSLLVTSTLSSYVLS